MRYAQKEVNEIRLKIKTLKSNLYLGHKFYEKDVELVREIFIKNYRVIYSIAPDHKQIEILTIHHHSRLLSNNPALNEE